MVAIIVFGLLFTAGLFFLLARYAPSAAAMRVERAKNRVGVDVRPAMAPAALHALVRELLTKGMAFELLEEEQSPDGSRMQLRKGGPLGETLYSVLLIPSPQGDVVEQAEIVELMQTTAALHSHGMLITPYRIDTSGFGDLPPELQFIDGPRLEALVARYLPARSAELGSHRLAPAAH